MFADAALYGGLFINAFVAATLLPAFSELTFATLLAAGEGVPIFLFLSVTAGNVLGSVLNWWLGLRLANFQSRKWFPFSAAQIKKATLYFGKYGKWCLLFSWLPIVGDPLTLVAGTLRTPLPIFLLLVTCGKSMRYAIILAAF